MAYFHSPGIFPFAQKDASPPKKISTTIYKSCTFRCLAITKAQLAISYRAFLFWSIFEMPADKVLVFNWIAGSFCHQNTFGVPGRRLRIVFLSNEDFFPRLKLFFIHPNEKICLHVKTEVGRQLVVNSACYKFLVLLFTMISWS